MADREDDYDWLDRNGIGGDEWTGLVWLHDLKVNAAWYRALVAIDDCDDKQPLIKLLQSGESVPPGIAFYIGDLLERYNLKRPNNRPRRPGYRLSPENIKLMVAVVEVYGRVHQDGAPLAETLKEIAVKTGLKEETLTDAYNGKHGGLRRAKRNWYRFRS